MIIIFLLIPLSIVTAAIFLCGFIWAVKSGQYEDTCTPSMRLLMEDADSTKRREEKSLTEGINVNRAGAARPDSAEGYPGKENPMETK